MIRTKKNTTIDISNNIPAIYISGANYKTVILMAHGIMGSKNEYLDTQARIAEALEDRGIASLRIDFCGHGDSDRSLNDFCLYSQIKDLQDSIQWLKKQQYESVVILGISFGAPPALIVSALYPDFVSKCVLVSPVLNYKDTFVFPSCEWGKENFGLFRILQGIQNNGISLSQDYTLSPKVLTDMLLVDVPSFVQKANLEISVFHGDSDNMVPLSSAIELQELCNGVKLIKMLRTEHGITEVDDSDFSSLVTKHNLDSVVNELCN